MYRPYKKINSKNWRSSGKERYGHTKLEGDSIVSVPGKIELAVKKLAKDYSSEIDISRDSISESAEIEAAKFSKSKMDPQRIISRAIFIDTLNKNARQEGVDDYVPRGIIGDDFGDYVNIPNLGKMDKTALSRIINYAQRKKMKADKRKGIEDLTINPTFLIATIAGIATGIFFLSPNITGNVIGNLTNTTSSIIGALLFLGGLTAAFFLFKR